LGHDEREPGCWHWCYYRGLAMRVLLHCVCAEAIYDKDAGVITLDVYIKEFDEHRFFPAYDKRDFYYKKPGVPVPDSVMYWIRDFWQGREFKMDLRDDPNRTSLTEDNEKEVLGEIMKQMNAAFDTLSQGLTDDQRRINQRVEELKSKDSKRFQND